jgi:hypothetical protein
LAAAESEKLRDQILVELARLDSADEAAIWARRMLPLKNTLKTDDGQVVEQAFQSRMTAIENGHKEDSLSTPTAELTNGPFGAESEAKSLGDVTGAAQARSDTASVDKSGLALPEPRRVRDKVHVQFVSKQPCLICGRRPADPHHCALPSTGRSDAR